MERIVYVNGEFLEKSNAKISVWDHGFLYGDGIFEGIRIYDKKIFKFKEHMERFYESARALMIDIGMDIEALSEVVLDTCRRNPPDSNYIRLVVSRGIGDLGINPRKCKKASIVVIVDRISLYPQELYDNGMEVIIAATRKTPAEAINPRAKSLNYLNNILAIIEANNADVGEAVMVNKEGYITECTVDNLFTIKNGIIRTPTASVGLLEGITRDTVIDLARDLGYKVEETFLITHDLYTADEVFLTGTGAELLPVIAVSKRVIGDGKPGPIYQELLEAFRELTKEGTPIFAEEGETVKM